MWNEFFLIVFDDIRKLGTFAYFTTIHLIGLCYLDLHCRKISKQCVRSFRDMIISGRHL